MFYKKTALLLIALLAANKIGFAQTPSSAIQELPLPFPLLQANEAIQKLNIQMVDCNFLSNPNSSPSRSTNLTAPMSVECHFYDDPMILVSHPTAYTLGRMYGDLGNKAQYAQTHVLITEPLVHQFLRRFTNAESLLYKTDVSRKQPATLTLLDAMSQPVWQYTLQAPPGISISQLFVDAEAVGSGYVVAYYDPAIEGVLLQDSGEVGFDATKIGVLLDRLDNQGKRTGTQKLMVDIQPDTRLIIGGEDLTLRLWQVKENQYALSLYSMALKTQSKVQGSYKVVFFKADGSIDHQAQINLEKQTAGGSRKFLIDRAGNILLLSYGGKGVEGWQSAFQAELTKYDTNGKVLWRHPVLPAKPPTGKAACLSWDLQETPRQEYLVVCEQRTYAKGQWQHDDVYHQLMGVLISQKGQEVWRAPLLSGSAMQGLYEVDEYGEWPKKVEIVFSNLDKIWLGVGGRSKAVSYEEWKKIVASDKNPLLGKYLGVHLYEITLPTP